jgi:hypothetical protein
MYLASQQDQNPSASPPYLFGNWSAGIRGRRADPITLGPEPTTLIFATVADDRRGLKIQKIQVRKLGTLTKNFFAFEQRVTFCSL